MKLKFSLLHEKSAGTLGTAGTASIHAGLCVPQTPLPFGDNGDKTEEQAICPQVSPVCPQTEISRKASVCAVSPLSPTSPTKKIETESETVLQWLVDTSNRGTIKVTSSWYATSAEILDAVPDAVSAVPLLEKTS